LPCPGVSPFLLTKPGSTTLCGGACPISISRPPEFQSQHTAFSFGERVSRSGALISRSATGEGLVDPAGVECSGESFPWVPPTARDFRPIRGGGARCRRGAVKCRGMSGALHRKRGEGMPMPKRTRRLRSRPAWEPSPTEFLLPVLCTPRAPAILELLSMHHPMEA